MRVVKKRYAEVILRKQGEGKKFDQFLSYSVTNESHKWTLEQYREILKQITDLTETHTFKEIKDKLRQLETGDNR